MDEGAYRLTREGINRLPCVFEKALLAREAVCEQSRKHAVAERETLACASPLARAGCAALHGLLRGKSAFAIGLTDTARILPHAVSMRIQCGGLAGLKAVIDPEATAIDVHRLVAAAQARDGGLDGLPFSRIVQGVAAWRGRRRSRGRPA
ncbi:MAG: hypothetical protein JNK22_15055 [Rhodocyclaceae bacterium]|nr:hypothetical protein [Rhodocyclaceae bacterium]